MLRGDENQELSYMKHNKTTQVPTEISIEVLHRSQGTYEILIPVPTKGGLGANIPKIGPYTLHADLKTVVSSDLP